MLRTAIITAICVFISAIGLIPELWKWHKIGKVRAAASDVKNLCISARSEAIRTGFPVSVIVRKDSVKHGLNTIRTKHGMFFAPESVVSFNSDGNSESDIAIVSDGIEAYVSFRNGMPDVEIKDWRNKYEE